MHYQSPVKNYLLSQYHSAIKDHPMHKEIILSQVVTGTLVSNNNHISDLKEF